MRAPAFAAVVVLTLALAIGANAAVFSVMYAVVWRALPYPAADRLVMIDAEARGVARAGVSDTEIRELPLEPGLFERVASVIRITAAVKVGDEMEQVAAARVTDGALELLGAEPLHLGRLPNLPRDIGPDGYGRAIVISYGIWQRLLGSDPAAIGRRIEVNNVDVEVVGVLRPDFRLFMPANTALLEVTDVWFPRRLERQGRLRGTIARLAPGISIDSARDRLGALARQYVAARASDYPDGRLRFDLQPLQAVVTADARPAMWALAGAVVFVLLIACVNVGNLMLARARARAPEMALRQALGASRLRLARQLFTETLILAVAGGAAGLLIAHAGVRLIDWLRPTHLPRQSEIAIDGTVVIFTAVLSIGVSLACGLLPALGSGRRAAAEALRSGRSNAQRSGLRRLQRGLVVAEVAFCLVLLVAGGLMLKTFMNLMSAPLGFDPDGILTAKMAMNLRQFSDHPQRVQLLTSAIDRVAALPGVGAVSAAGPLPLDYPFLRTYGRAGEDAILTSQATTQSVFPGYLSLVKIALKEGRDFTADDLISERKVVIVDERIAQQLWGGRAVGQRLAVGPGRPSTNFEVVGITRAVRSLRVSDAGMPHFFVPYDQFGLAMALVIATDRSAEAIGPAIKQTVESLGTSRPVYEIVPLQHYVDGSIGDTRFTMLVLVGFATAALLLAAVGIYGTLSYLMAQRRQELAVRLALGASARQVLAGVLGEGLLLAALGAVAGLAGSAVASTALNDLLYGVTPFDLTTLSAVTGTLAAVAVAATAVPAIRAARTDPAQVLRAE